MNQYMPSKSTLASIGIGWPVAILVNWILTTCCHVSMTEEVQTATAVLCSSVVGYFFPGGKHIDTVDEPSVAKEPGNANPPQA